MYRVSVVDPSIFIFISSFFNPLIELAELPTKCSVSAFHMGKGDSLSSLALMTSNSESDNDVSKAPRAMALDLTSKGVYVADAAAVVEADAEADVADGSSNHLSNPSILMIVMNVSDQFAKLV